MTKTKVRFHLAKGENFMKWQVKCGDEVEYYSPSVVQLQLENCKLRNQPSTAKKIHNGANKTVCAWIECDKVTVHPLADGFPDAQDFLYYNPKVRPYWHCSQKENKDNATYGQLVTHGQLITVPRT